MNVFLLVYLGACLVEQPYIIISQLSSILYFSYFLIFIPILSFAEKIAYKVSFWSCVELF